MLKTDRKSAWPSNIFMSGQKTFKS